MLAGGIATFALILAFVGVHRSHVVTHEYGLLNPQVAAMRKKLPILPYVALWASYTLTALHSEFRQGAEQE